MLNMAILFVICSGMVLAGGGKRNGTSGANELLIPVGGQGFGLSGSYLAGLRGAEAIYYNPAGIVGADNNVEVIFSEMKQIADINVSYGAIAARIGEFGSFALSVKALNFGDIPVTTIANESGDGSTYSPAYINIGASYSANLTDRIRVGFTGKLISEKIMRTSANGFAVDAGVQYIGFAGVNGLQLGIVMKNLGSQMKFDGADLLRSASESNALRGIEYYQIVAASFSLPSMLEIGMAYQGKLSNNFSGLFAATYQDNSFQNDEIKLGAEISYSQMLFLRSGYSLIPQAGGEEDNIYGPTFGVGFKFDTDVKISVDYAYRSVKYFDANHMFSVKLGF